ncbi:hypothetical protein [Rickettsiales endosymbiont of Stachyamoeba lipophora]|uniref:hypothetical protein n=1 Tax=Rickettsiales endosymbiont of Stachyamoeba lipophora TaxID=2486578 RepID=UPI000F653887|nr:hypothetical protein [Rickettsiales endosymbiont of Stachyamoeba lipophora]AZL15003.1 hypothetical protein EF513_00260 [Rickettsiales endosymbiont of Stachyamoeba lipophora]
MSDAHKYSHKFLKKIDRSTSTRVRFQTMNNLKAGKTFLNKTLATIANSKNFYPTPQIADYAYYSKLKKALEGKEENGIIKKIYIELKKVNRVPDVEIKQNITKEFNRLKDIVIEKAKPTNGLTAENLNMIVNNLAQELIEERKQLSKINNSFKNQVKSVVSIVVISAILGAQGLAILLATSQIALIYGGLGLISVQSAQIFQTTAALCLTALGTYSQLGTLGNIVKSLLKQTELGTEVLEIATTYLVKPFKEFEQAIKNKLTPELDYFKYKLSHNWLETETILKTQTYLMKAVIALDPLRGLTDKLENIKSTLDKIASQDQDNNLKLNILSKVVETKIQQLSEIKDPTSKATNIILTNIYKELDKIKQTIQQEIAPKVPTEQTSALIKKINKFLDNFTTEFKQQFIQGSQQHL